MCRLLRCSLRSLHLRQQHGSSAADATAAGGHWVSYDCRSGEEAPEDGLAAALLGSDASTAAAEQAGGSSGRPAAPSPQQEQQQQQQRRVWVGFTGETPAAHGEGQQQQQQQWPPPTGKKRSPSKFERLASGSPSPEELLAPRKLIVTN